GGGFDGEVTTIYLRLRATRLDDPESSSQAVMLIAHEDSGQFEETIVDIEVPLVDSCAALVFWPPHTVLTPANGSECGTVYVQVGFIVQGGEVTGRSILSVNSSGLDGEVGVMWSN